MIEIKKSSTADTRTCDWSKVSVDQLYNSSVQHIDDVDKALKFFREQLFFAAQHHDRTKLSDINGFHRDFQTGFKTQEWFEMHKREERHHINYPEGLRDDVNLIDVLEHIADCVMAGMGRSGSVYELKVPDEVLQKAFANTVKQLTSQVRVVD